MRNTAHLCLSLLGRSPTSALPIAIKSPVHKISNIALLHERSTARIVDHGAELSECRFFSLTRSAACTTLKKQPATENLPRAAMSRTTVIGPGVDIGPVWISDAWPLGQYVPTRPVGLCPPNRPFGSKDRDVLNLAPTLLSLTTCFSPISMKPTNHEQHHNLGIESPLERYQIDTHQSQLVFAPGGMFPLAALKSRESGSALLFSRTLNCLYKGRNQGPQDDLSPEHMKIMIESARNQNSD